MLFKVDENLPAEVVTLLKDAGHDAKSVLDQSLGGATDVRVADLCRAESRIIVTLDLDFADIRTYPPAQSPGFVVFRLARQSTAMKRWRLISSLSLTLNTAS